MLSRIGIFVFALAMVIIVVSVVEFLVPLALGIDGLGPSVRNDLATLTSYWERQPTGHFLGIAFAHALGALVAGFVLALGRLPKLALWGMMALLTVGGYASLGTYPGHPIWFAGAILLAYAPAAWVGWRWVERTREVVAQRAGQS